MGLAHPRVAEAERENGQTYVTLACTIVTGKHNAEEEMWLDETETRALIRDLQTALLRAARLSTPSGA